MLYHPADGRCPLHLFHASTRRPTVFLNPHPPPDAPQESAALAPPLPDNAGLRNKVLRGGTFMVGRQAIGMIVSLVGVILVTRIIGPGQYGRFAACVGIFTYFSYLCGWGIDIYLMRRPEGQAPPALFHQAFTLILGLSLFAGGVGLILARPIEAMVDVQGFAPMIAMFFLGLPIALAAIPAHVKLERDLNYQAVAVIELITLFQFQGTALLLAYLGWGAWSLIVSWAINQVLALTLFTVAARYVPRLAWSWSATRDMLCFGLGYTASTCTIQMRTLINPLIVAPLAGVTAAGFVGMAIMFVFRLSIVKTMSEKMAVAALAKVQDRRPRVRELLGEGMRLHVLCVGLPLVGFSLVAPWLIPLLMGPEWRPVADLVPLISIGFLVNAVFSLHSSILQIYRRNWDVAIFNAVLMTILFGTSAWLIAKPELGFIGYGWAEVATLPAYLVIHFFLRRQIGSPDYAVSLVWTLGLSLLMLLPWLGWPALVGAGAILLWPATWKSLGEHLQQVRGIGQATA